jgi:hypothetical protein
MLLLFAWVPLRIAADLLLVAMGAYLAWICIRGVSGFPASALSQMPMPWFIPTWTFFFISSVGSLLIFGRDLIHCVFRRNPRPLC